MNFDTNLIKIEGELSKLWAIEYFKKLVEWVLPFWIFNEVSQILKIIFLRLYV